MAEQRKKNRPQQGIKILTFATLFPNCVQPIHGIFVEQRLRHLISSGKISARVIAPVPWFPIDHKFFGKYAPFARVPRHESRNGLQVDHPRFLAIPKIGMSIAPKLLASASLRFIKSHHSPADDFDLIDAHYFYPDGVAAIHLGQTLDKPVVITGRGTDLNVIPNHALPRQQIAWAANRAAGLITVTEALKSILIRLGIAEDRIVTLRNGVDLKVFQPVNREQARRHLRLARKTILSVGHLIQRKGHDFTIRALAELPDVDLLIVGDGPEKSRLLNLTKSLQLSDYVHFVGQVPQADLPTYYSAADAMVLASSWEGWANVLLESMACGTPVVAMDIDGNREVVKAKEAGLLIVDRSPTGLASGIRAILDDPPEREATRAYAGKFSWTETTQGQIRLFEQILAGQN